MTDLKKLVKEIITNNQYLALSTVGQEHKSWTCILAYAFDENFNFYFVSLPDSKHSKNIETHNSVTFAIYDSTQGFGVGTGLQIEAIAKKVNKIDSQNIKNIYFGRKYPFGNPSNNFTEGLRGLIDQGVYNFYKLSPLHIWINDPNADTDKRVEVDLN